MRVPLPGRDYFPPRVLLRSMPRAEREDRSPAESVHNPLTLLPAPATLPAAPPSPMMEMRPSAA
ncbi:hypothetical protein [Muricoccus pecuniae]|uniref:Uncharacterized protein n=1 Tax=Muricoccus pecuniae TaxID=693023 RepID=A0A840Y8S7_9PROT|nr:hypothetical protein [Roseomonas pecuniae]MBB5695149.1 hypothetical protein [Roseomonas pecuniae]